MERAATGLNRYQHPWAVALMLGSVPYAAAFVLFSINDSARTAMLLEQVLFLAPYMAASVMSLRLARTVPSSERLFWLMLGLCLALLLVAEVDFSIRQIVGGPLRDPVTLSAVALILPPALLFLGLIVSMSRIKDAELSTQMRFLADVLIAVVAIGALAWVHVVRPYLSARGAGDALTASVATGHVMVASTMLIGTGSVLFGLKARAWRLWERLVVLGIVVYALGLLMWPWWYGSTWLAGATGFHPLELALCLGPYLVVIGAAARLESDRDEEALRVLPPFRFRSTWLPLAFHAVAVLLLPVIAYWALLQGRSADGYVALAAAIVIALLLVFRGVWVALEGGHLFESASRDPLTRLYSYPFFAHELDRHIDLALREGSSVPVLVHQVDDLHRVNAVSGNHAGDSVLRTVAGVLESTIPVPAMCGRTGGDEFAVALPGVDLADAIGYAEECRLASRRMTECTLSVGVARFPEDGVDGTEVLRRARDGAAWAKRHGKDRVVVADAIQPRSEIALSTEGVGETTEDHDEMTLRLLADAVDARSARTRYHSRAVSDLAGDLARELGFDGAHCNRIRRAGRAHDVGKVVLSRADLDRGEAWTGPGGLAMDGHAVVGERIVAGCGFSEEARWIRHHHEWFDGRGKPDGIAGIEIPMEAQILAVCDAYVVLTTGSGHRRALSHPAAVQEIDLRMGTQFDPVVADAFLSLVIHRFAFDHKDGMSRPS